MTSKSTLSTLALSFAMAGAVTAIPARADEANYAELGRWRVNAITNAAGFAACTADVDNGKVQLRIRSDGRATLVGVPYYGNRRSVEGYYGFGDAAEVGSFAKVDDGWAMLRFNADQVQALRSLPSFAVNLDRGLQTFNLRGAGPALDKAAECVRNRGLKQAAATQNAAPSAGMGRNCPQLGRFRSLNSNERVSVTFFNGLKVPLDIMWIDFAGNWKKYHTLRPDSHVVQKTFGTHPWVAVDQQGNCRGPVMMPKPRAGEDDNHFQIF